MAVTTFDTLKYVRRLEQAGMAPELAEVQAEVLTEAFAVNLESLVSKEYLDTRFAEQNWSIDTRFAEQKAYIDTRFAEIKAEFRTLYWILGVIMVAVILPYLERLLAL